MVTNKVWTITRWDYKGVELDSVYFHSKLPVWFWKLVARFIVIPAPHQRFTELITMYTTADGVNPEITLWERKRRAKIARNGKVS